MEFRVREANYTDLTFVENLLVDICKLHAKWRDDIFKPMGRKYFKDYLAIMLENDDCFIDICETFCGERVGYCIQNLNLIEEDSARFSRKVLFVNDLNIAQSHRSKGAGTLMMQAVRERAHKLKCDAIELNVWDANKKAMRFYEKLGFLPQKHILELKVEKSDAKRG